MSRLHHRISQSIQMIIVMTMWARALRGLVLAIVGVLLAVLVLLRVFSLLQ